MRHLLYIILLVVGVLLLWWGLVLSMGPYMMRPGRPAVPPESEDVNDSNGIVFTTWDERWSAPVTYVIDDPNDVVASEYVEFLPPAEYPIINLLTEIRDILKANVCECGKHLRSETMYWSPTERMWVYYHCERYIGGCLKDKGKSR